MARLTSSDEHKHSVIPTMVSTRILLVRRSGNDGEIIHQSEAHEHPRDGRHTVPGSQRLFKQEWCGFARDNPSKAQLASSQLPLQSDELHNNAVRATPKRAAKATVKYDFARMSPSDESLQESHDSEWAGGSDEEGDHSEIRDAGLWKSVRVPAKFQQIPVRSQIFGEESLKARQNVIDLTSPENRIPQSVMPLRIATAELDDFRSGFTSSSDSDIGAFIRFSPPRLKSPFKNPPQKETTPPQSPSKSKLNSPQKLRSHIPPTPHRPSIDAFWSQDVVNTWNEQYSPRKVIRSPRKIRLPESDDDDDHDALVFGSPTKSPTKKLLTGPIESDRTAAAVKKAFEAQKHKIAEDFLCEVDEKIGGGQIAKLAESTGGIKLIWNKKLNSTAGRANWRREAVKSRDGDGQVVNTTYRHLASIELAEKVIDDEHRLLNVLAHEYCHLANFMLSNVRDQPHGASFKRWAAQVSAAFAHRDIKVTTKHTYEIKYKYAWVCVDEEGCGIEYQRHSRSIDPLRHTCGKCKGRLRQVRPVPRKAKGGSANGQVGVAGEGGCDGRSEYQRFVKEHFGQVREELGGKSPMKDVMKELGARYRSRKDETGGRTVVGGKAKSSNSRTVEVVEILDSDEEAELDDRFDDGQEKGGKDEGEVDRVSRVLDFLTIRDE